MVFYDNGLPLGCQYGGAIFRTVSVGVNTSSDSQRAMLGLRIALLAEERFSLPRTGVTHGLA